ncbi:ATP-dependent nuclease [Taibaiella chishuiensis]|uniref:Putative ATP-dependent endonuclease of OLD family n=1 Tax=Taibaiella chishuiensis TaxID=1434707 RepID=A0A2P8D0T0_9BACT|nr:AAA family ATPase [Taibaiella chishuiensis]PSK90832.1 putative ATP-dependent endonuclease of OLD family [Taibaiella chishuiensis]
MKITHLSIKNFRLLKNVNLSLEEKTTVIVGRNNSGKTSLTEIFRRLLADKTPSFQLYDFSISAIEEFKMALKSHLLGEEENLTRAHLPVIELKITITYDEDTPDLGVLGDFIVDLNPDCTTVEIIIRYELQDGSIKALFEGITDESADSINQFIKDLKDNVPKLFQIKVLAQDPNDETNFSNIDYTKFKQLIGGGFINAQRGLDDVTHTEKDVLGKVLAKLFKTASGASAPEDLRQKSSELDLVIKELQLKVDNDFNVKVNALLPALQLFGYPGLADPNLSTETTLNISNILDSHTKIRYSQGNGMYLPETYNGLGSRNLIYMLFQLFEFFREWQSSPVTNGLYLVFIEEPEAHLHPQMQQVFIKQVKEIASEFSRTLNDGNEWPVQFVVTTHSTHIANEANFDSVRYFFTARNQQKETKIKDLRKEFSAPGLLADKEFLHKYLTLTKCDLFFADKAILIEGATERILMPMLIQKTDEIQDQHPKLIAQYISLIEVGGAYAHHFYKFLDFLELRTLVITDLDSVLKTENNGNTTYPACAVADGSHSTNAGIKNWFDGAGQGYIALAVCTGKTAEEKINGFRRIAYQIVENGHTFCGRSFEDAFMLANTALFELTGPSDAEFAAQAYNKSDKIEKTNFALKYALEEVNWVPPLYISDGLKWLSDNPNIPAEEVQEILQAVIEEVPHD